MPVNLSIKNAPDAVVERLRRRAERHHRSLQGELMAIIEAASNDDDDASSARPMTGADLVAALQASPYREIEIEPERIPMPVRDVDL